MRNYANNMGKTSSNIYFEIKKKIALAISLWKIMLRRHTFSNHWDLPTGHLHDYLKESLPLNDKFYLFYTFGLLLWKL